jgi:hypothetical protein
MVLLSLNVDLDFPNLGCVQNYLALILPYYFPIGATSIFVELAHSYEVEPVENLAHLGA